MIGMRLYILKIIFSSSFLLGAILNGRAQGPGQEKVKYTSGFFSSMTHKVKYGAVKNNLEHGLSSFSINPGLSSYFGDLCKGGECMTVRPSLGIGYSYRWDRRVSFRSEFNYYRLFSDDYYKQRNFTFRSDNYELYVGLTYDIIPFSAKYQYRHSVIPYVFGGAGITHFNPKGKYNGHWYELQPLRTEGNTYSRVTAIIPFGFGARIKVMSCVDLMLEMGFRKTFTDRLDDVSSQNFQSVNSFSSPVASALSNQTGMGDSYTQYRGNPHKKDMYSILQLKVVFTPKGRVILRN
jgi:hypothetical protein